MANSLHEALVTAMDAVEPIESAPAQFTTELIDGPDVASSSETAQQQEDRARDEAGRFAKNSTAATQPGKAAASLPSGVTLPVPSNLSGAN